MENKLDEEIEDVVLEDVTPIKEPKVKKMIIGWTILYIAIVGFILWFAYNLYKGFV